MARTGVCRDPVNYQCDMNMDYPLYSPSQTENSVMKWKGVVSAVISAVIPPRNGLIGLNQNKHVLNTVLSKIL